MCPENKQTRKQWKQIIRMQKNLLVKENDIEDG